jgi:hypothetical protein
LWSLGSGAGGAMRCAGMGMGMGPGSIFSTITMRPSMSSLRVLARTRVPRSASRTSAKRPLPGVSIDSAASCQTLGSSGIDTLTALPLARSMTVKLLSRSLT